MKRTIIFSALLAFTAIMIFAFVPDKHVKHADVNMYSGKGDGIKFMEADWSKALQEAKKQNKPVFLDAYTTWCGPCRMLKQNTFTDKAVGEFFNKNFINVALDMEKGDGIAVGAKYQINAYPTLIITDADQKSVSVTEGYMGPARLLEFGKSVLAQKRK
jgi:thiol-disulfide isomerase/thioredoxin